MADNQESVRVEGVTLGAGESAQPSALAQIPTAAGALIAAMHGDGNNPLSVPKPFSDPICLIPDARVAGTTHVEGIGDIARSLAEGDSLRLERDPKNRNDQWSIRVFDVKGNRLGFVPADVNEIPARLMDGGKRLYGEVTEVGRRGSWWRIGMAVWLDD